MKKADKSVIINKLSSDLSNAKSAVLVNYSGLSVKKQQELSKELKKVGAQMLVVKNTLLKRAATEAKLPSATLEDSVLTGQTAVVIGKEDSISPLQILGKFAQENEIPQFKVGIIEGKFQDKDSLIKISKLPNKETLYAQVIGAISSPMYELVGTLQGNLQKLIWILQFKHDADGGDLNVRK